MDQFAREVEVLEHRKVVAQGRHAELGASFIHVSRVRDRLEDGVVAVPFFDPPRLCSVHLWLAFADEDAVEQESVAFS